MRNKISLFLYLVVLTCFSSCEDLLDQIKDPKGHQPKVQTFVSGLTAPLGMETDARGRLWVTEPGTGVANDGQLSLITPQGVVYPVVTGFPSGISPEGAVFGLNHLLLQDGILWMLHGVEGRLYKFDITAYQPGDAPLQASALDYEDIGTFVKNYPFEEDTDESDIFNLTIGPEGDLYMVDAGANAIIRRRAATGELSMFAAVPPVDNPGGDPARVEAVPTGIVFDGHKFLVSIFTGFPFPAQKGTIYQVDLQGNFSVYQTGLSNLADLELGVDWKPVVVVYGTWTGEGFAANSGAIVHATPQKNTQVVGSLNFPNSIERAGPRAYYVARTFDGVIEKISF